MQIEQAVTQDTVHPEEHLINSLFTFDSSPDSEGCIFVYLILSDTTYWDFDEKEITEFNKDAKIYLLNSKLIWSFK